MAMILRVDEMVDALLQLDHPDAGALRDQLVAQANLAGQILQDSLKVKVAPAGWDHAALGGGAMTDRVLTDPATVDGLRGRLVPRVG